LFKRAFEDNRFPGCLSAVRCAVGGMHRMPLSELIANAMVCLIVYQAVKASDTRHREQALPGKHTIAQLLAMQKQEVSE
jgi:hypothetical protein